MKKIAIIGAGISGLYIANLFKDHKDYRVTIYEKRNSIEMEEGYGIQLSVNSVKLLNKIGFASLTKEEKFNPKKIDFYEIKNSKKISEVYKKFSEVFFMSPLLFPFKILRFFVFVAVGAILVSVISPSEMSENPPQSVERSY